MTSLPSHGRGDRLVRASLAGMGLLACLFFLRPAAHAAESLNFPTMPAAMSQRGSEESRPFGVRELVEMSSLGPMSLSEGESPIVFSPDKRRFFFIRRRGELSADAQLADLYVFEVDAVRRAVASRDRLPPKPAHVVSMRTDADGDAIRGARWQDDKESILFLGQQNLDADEPFELYRLNARSGVLTRLSAARSKKKVVAEFSVSGEGLVFRQFQRMPPPAQRSVPYFADVGDFRNSLANTYDVSTENAFFASYGNGAPWQMGRRFVALNGRSDFLATRFFVSPSGRMAVVRMPAELIPGPRSLKMEEGGGGTLVDGPSTSYRLLSVDLSTGEYHTLTAASIAPGASGFMSVLWEPDETRVIVVGAPPVAGEGFSIVEYKVDGSGLRAVGSVEGKAQITAVRWTSPGRKFEVVSAGGRLEFSKAVQAWNKRSTARAPTSPEPRAPEKPSGLSIFVREDANTPPQVVASAGGRELVIGPRDEVLAGVDIARVEPVTWTDGSGRQGKGGLLLPRQRKEGERLAAVIQLLREFPMNRFRPGGFEPVATFAAQALVSEGFAVLQLDCAASGIPFGPDEGPSSVSMLDGAVAYLDRRGIIDPARVGLVGHSRTAYRVNYALTNPGRTKFAAAISNEGFAAGYTQYLQNMIVFNEIRPSIESAYHGVFEGGGDFWHNKAAWLATAPGFNLEKVSTPLLLTMAANGHEVFTGEPDIEIYAGLKILHKAVDYLWFPKGSHVMQWPRGRFASQQATVDWMAFWLKGQESSAPERQDQNRRWRELREQSAAQAGR